MPYNDNVVPQFILPVFAYTRTSLSATGQIVTGQTNVVAVVSAVPTTSSTLTPPKPSSSSKAHNVGAVSTLSLPTPQLDFDHLETCGTTPRGVNLGWITTVNVPRHNHDFFHDILLNTVVLQVYFFLLFLLHLFQAFEVEYFMTNFWFEFSCGSIFSLGFPCSWDWICVYISHL